jgi:hypothetical protein
MVLMLPGTASMVLQEATEALKPVLGQYYKSDHGPLLKAIWRDWTLCRCGRQLRELV